MLGPFFDKLQRAIGSDDPDALVDVVLEAAGELFESEVTSFGRLDVLRGQLVFSHRSGETRTSEDRVDASAGIPGWVVRRVEAVLSNDVLSDPRHVERREPSAGPVRSVVCVPIVEAGVVVGVLQVQNARRRGGYTGRDLEGITALARLLGRLWSVPAPSDEAPDPAQSVFLRGRDPVLRETLRAGAAAAASETPIVIRGERGVGKETLARWIHEESARHGPFLRAPCRRRDVDTLAEDLFGVAATSRRSGRPGWLESARGGTIFFDEIAALPRPLQAPLAHVLHERQLVRIGGAQSLPLDVRVMAASPIDPHEAVHDGKLREELRSRIQVVTLDLPPLRDRAHDIPELVAGWLEELSREQGRPDPRLDASAVRCLSAHPWPGNVRELRAVLELTLSRQPADHLGVADLPADVRGAAAAEVRLPEPVRDGVTLAEAVDEFRTACILRALEAAGGNQTRAAEMLGLKQPNLSRIMRALGIRS